MFVKLYIHTYKYVYIYICMYVCILDIKVVRTYVYRHILILLAYLCVERNGGGGLCIVEYPAVQFD